MMRLGALTGVVLTGLSGCATVNEAGLCAGIAAPVAALRSALLSNPQTPDAVGEAGADVVIGIEAGCQNN